MHILLGFAPYIAFFLFMQAASIDLGLWAALIVAVLNAAVLASVDERNDRAARRSDFAGNLRIQGLFVTPATGRMN